MKHRRAKKVKSGQKASAQTETCTETSLLPNDSYSAMLQAALALHQQGRLDEAEGLYQEILRRRPNHFDALQLLATLAAQKKNFLYALELFEQVLKISSSHSSSFNNRGLVLQGLKRYEEALASYDKALFLNPDDADACHNRGIVLKELQQYEDAIASYDRALVLKPDYADAYYNRGNALTELKRYEEALLSYENALIFHPDFVDVYNNRGSVFVELNRYEEAVESYDKALVLKPDHADAYYNRGNALQGLMRYEDALVSYEVALDFNPDNSDACRNRAFAFMKLQRYEEALSCFDQVLALKPDVAESYFNRGIVLKALKHYQEALASYDKALVLDHDNADIYYNRGNVLKALMRYEEAAVSYDKALTIKSGYDFLLGLSVYLRMKTGDWSTFDHQCNKLVEKIEHHEKVSPPFPVLAIADSFVLQKEAAKIFVQERCPANHALPEIYKRARHERIRIGYYSADFHDHATTRLMAELFEAHDRSRFELFAFSFGSDKQDNMKKRVAASFDRFFDVRNQSDNDVAMLSRELEIDIAIDLKGFTTDSRTGIFALRAAPIQVNYLGYPGTMGAEYIDYLIADRILIPESSQYGYTEKIVYLPDSYQVNDRKRRIAERIFTRKECGLPENGFVFCCFNNNYKIIPSTFDSWMRILKEVPESVLWLLEDNPKVAENLRCEAIARGVDAERLIFAPRMVLAEHLARHRQADLFLDTLPYNAHTTASDALWAGLPVLTCLGEAFAGRVAASLLHAIQLPELITSTQEEYEALAIELARHPQKLALIHRKLEQNRLTTPLFDTQRFARHIEIAYTKMYERYQADLLPDHLVIEYSSVHGKSSRTENSVKDCTPLIGKLEQKGRVPSATLSARDDRAAQLQSALVLHQQGHFDEAEVLYQKILRDQPEHFDALQLLATIAAQKKRFEEAVALFDRALKINPAHPETLNNYGNAFMAIQRYEEALANYNGAIALRPDYADAYNNRAFVLKKLIRYEDAIRSYDEAIALNADDVDAWYNRGNILLELNRDEEAVLSYDRVIALKPDYTTAHFHRGIARQKVKRYDEALSSYDKALSLNPDYDFLFGICLHTKMQMCDWQFFGNQTRHLVEKIEHYEKVSPPFLLLAIADSLVLQKEAAKIFVQERCPANHALPEICRRARHERIRIGYYSADFHDHATTRLMAELFEAHDRSRFELCAFSFGPYQQDEMKKRVAASFDRFFDVRNQSDNDVATLSRELEIDIAIDLKGFTTDSRTGIFALRAAPIQVNYLGYPGTMGAEYIDYLIADRILIPESSQYGYTEKIVYLPGSYQVNDRKRRIAERIFTRKECGLPEKGFVFCCFNNNYKITPSTFDSWMRILKEVPESVFWLLEDNPKVAENLRCEAIARGVLAERLIFAPRWPLAEHLARHRRADLFLDTLPCNAHTTASDALWAGLPVLTCMGEAFAGRVAASLLHAIQLPELITSKQEEYEALAIELARHPQKLAQICRKLEQNRLATPLFDTPRFARHIEAAYTQMYERYQADLRPDHLVIEYPSVHGKSGRKERLLRDCAPFIQQLVSPATQTLPARDDRAAQLQSALVLHQQGHLDEAEVFYQEILRDQPEHFDALQLLATIAAQKKRFEEAVALFDRALKINPAHPDALNNYGNALMALQRDEEALASYDMALALKPDYVDAYNNRGIVLLQLKRYEEAQVCYEKAFELNPDFDFLLGLYLHARMKIGDWSAFDYYIPRLTEKIERCEKVTMPFHLLAIVDSLYLQKESARIYACAIHPCCKVPPVIARYHGHERIRIGYYSADFHDHATTRLMAELFEAHDRSRFELVAFSFGIDQQDDMTRRVAASFDRFFDVRNQSDNDVATLSRELEIDIAIDLKGFTTDSRTGIFALRAAPIQVNYLGYPGTMGAEYIDYLIADRILIPESSQYGYTEKIVYLPDSYQVNDRKRRIAERIFTRKECGLPEKGFVFCCFNNNYKITPSTFDSWMRILKEVSESVLWLLEDNPKVAENLRCEAIARGVHAERLIFVPRMVLAEHLARHRQADLFLDTLPCNAHTTASDALWAGLPVLTCMGEAFASRVAASLLHAIQLPELITSTQEEYEALAIELARHPQKLAQIRRKLEQNRLTTPLFDTPRFARHIEIAYTKMYERYQADLLPDHLFIEYSSVHGKSGRKERLLRDCAPFIQQLVSPATQTLPARDDRAAQLQSALVLHQQGHLDEAEVFYQEILRDQPEHFDALQLLATIAAQKKRFEEAVALFDRALKINPDHPNMLNNRGVALKALTRYEEALWSYDKALALKPDYADACYNRAFVLKKLMRYEDAIKSYDEAIALNADYADAWYNRGNTLLELNRYEEALLSYDRVIALKPDDTAAHFNRGIALQRVKRNEDALVSYEKALALRSDAAETYNKIGNVFTELQRYEEALDSYQKVFAFKPDNFQAHCNRGVVLTQLQRYEEAFESFEQALVLKPGCAEIYYNLGILFTRLKRYEEALERYEKALVLKPGYDFLFGLHLQTKMQICDWQVFGNQMHQLFEKIERHEKVSAPFSLLAVVDSLSLQKEAARIFVQEKCPVNQALPNIHKRGKHERIRIGYYSADFHDHATTRLMVELFEAHDRTRFELIAFSFGIDKQDEMKKRVAASFDRFFDVRNQSDNDVATLSRKLEIDIAIDLKGFTLDSRTGIFALRAAPVQVNYLGYPGTMGAEYIDYLIADRTLIPESSQYGYTEKIVYLPDSYQVNDRTRRIAERIFTRNECGLPENGFVFCCFNNNYKITPSTFDSWMRILKEVPESVLWLLEDNPKAAGNLLFEASVRGVTAERLIFAPRMAPAEHLARHCQADLFLDTLPCNAHTTASDALWAGLPVLTCMGEAFAGRVAASLLHAIQLPELITSTREEYEALAIELARHPQKLAQICRKLEQNRLTTPLFDTQRFARHIETAYTKMYERYQADLRPDHLVIEYSSMHDKSGRKEMPARNDHAAQLQFALVLHQQGHWDEAEVFYQEVLRDQPEHFDALQFLAIVAAQKKRSEEAIVLFDRALKINPANSDILNNRGMALQDLGLYKEALLSYDKACALSLDSAEIYYNRANVLLKLKQHEDAIKSYKRALVLKVDYADAYYNLGNALRELIRYEEALASYDKAIEFKPDLAKIHYNRARTLKELTRYEEALAGYDRALTLTFPALTCSFDGVTSVDLADHDGALAISDMTLALKADFVKAYTALGFVFIKLKHFNTALLSYDKALALSPDVAQAYCNRGIALKKLGRYEEALASYDKVLALKPDFAEAWYNLGNVFLELRRYEEALASYDKALALKPDFAEALYNLGSVLLELKRYEAALASYDKAIMLKPDFAETNCNYGVLSTELRQYEKALASYDKVLAFRPGYDYLFGIRLHTQMLICDWKAFDDQVYLLVEKIVQKSKATSPFPFLALKDSLSLQKEVAMLYVQEKYPKNHVLPEIQKYVRHERIRIGYYSADFHDHATTRLMVQLFEAHDRSRFELFAFSFGADKQDDMRKRVAASFDHFFDVQNQSDNDVALLSRNLEIDIAIDLKGFTANARVGLFALRAAPVQVNYLGYPGTIGAEYIDYLIADRTLIPESSQHGYTEKIVYLPDSYQVNDTKRLIAEKLFTRQECGLPENRFVFCCFNNNYKITPSTFEGWMRILKLVPKSVFWLLEDNPKAAENLRKEALKRGVDSDRLIFAKRIPVAEHLARHRLADLFLDTFPCNAHTTASDALWGGLPLLTLAGESFASRVAASLLNAIQLPELITTTEEEYEALAIELATHPEKLTAIRQKLEKNRLTTPLFDTELFTRNLEKAYMAMYERYQEGVPPDHICSDGTKAVYQLQ